MKHIIDGKKYGLLEWIIMRRLRPLYGERRMTSEQEALLLEVFRAAKELRDSGYDGPFIGKPCERLFRALAAYEGSFVVDGR